MIVTRSHKKGRVFLSTSCNKILHFLLYITKDFPYPRCAMKTTGFLFFFLLITALAQAQYWQVLPTHTDDKGVSAYFSQDDKKIFYLAPNPNGVKNVMAYELKGAITSEVTKYESAVLRAIPVLSRPNLIVMKATEFGDIHLYRLKNDGSEELDITPSAAGINHELLGSSYNGKYIYYSRIGKKTDYFRYDASQNISETILPNDKDFKLLAWSRDQKCILLQEPKTSQVLIYTIETTERNQLYMPVSGKKVATACFSADNKQLLVLESGDGKSELRSVNMSSPSTIGEQVKPIDDGSPIRYDVSTNGKFIFVYKPGLVTVKDAASFADVFSASDIIEVISNPKETLLLLTKESAGVKSIQLYDIAKKTTIDIVTIK